MATLTAFLPRTLHPGAWWVWALGLVVAASRTSNPLLLLLIVAVAGYVVAARRTPAPWSRSFATFLRLGLFVLVLRLVFQILFGAMDDGPVLFTLPEIPLPDWAAGIRIGGPVTLPGVLFALYEGMRLAALLACFGAANSLANPSRLLRLMPAALYEVGVAVVVAVTLAPQLVTDVGRVRQAQRLRGRADRGLAGFAGVAMPVLEGALDRSLALAAAMDSRGYGRSAGVAASTRRLTAALLLTGLVGVSAGTFGLLDGGTTEIVGMNVLGLPLLVGGIGIAAIGFTIAGRRVPRTRYRPDPWGLPEWLVAGSGVAAAAVLIASSVAGIDLLGAVSPPSWPALPLLPAAGILLALLPAWAATMPAEDVR